MSVAYSDTTLADDDYADAWCPRPSSRRLRVVPAHVPVHDAPHSLRRETEARVAVLHAPLVEASPARLTRRGVVVLTGLVLALGGAVVAVAALCAPAPVASASPAVVVTVRPGDTLWSIASAVAPNADPQAEIDMIERLNDLRSVSLVPGQQLRTR